MKQLFILLAILLIASCGSPKTAGIGEVLRPDPTTGLPYPIYDNFDAIEPLFNQQNDTTYIVNFWATWCKPCVEELPHFQELNEKYAGQPLRIVLVSLDFK
ncbi:MAG: thioredoxin domain-containing protein, partial [Bacteroidota bacterium]